MWCGGEHVLFMSMKHDLSGRMYLVVLMALNVSVLTDSELLTGGSRCRL